jgi:hypothetical protein
MSGGGSEDSKAKKGEEGEREEGERMNPGGYESEGWFKGTMSREDAEQYLKTHTTTASFLVRNSSTPACCACRCA